MFTIGDVSLQDGLLYSSMTTKSTYGQTSGDQAASQLFKVTCAFDIEKRPDLSRGETISVHATITQSDNGSVLLQCER